MSDLTLDDLTETDHTQLTGAERRRDTRYELATPGLVADRVGVHDCMVVDISFGGCMLEGDFHMRNGMEVAVGFDKLMGLVGDFACGAGLRRRQVSRYSGPAERHPFLDR